MTSSQNQLTAGRIGRVRTVLEMIKFEHSIFALPFALTGALLAARYAQPGGGWPTARQIFWIVVAMVGARSAAMTVNRIVDVHYDRANPRTSSRALATGALTTGFAWGFTAASAALLVVAAWQLNPAGTGACAGSARHPVFVFLHEALHDLVACGAGFLPGDFTRGGLDCGGGVARYAHADSVRRGNAVGGRL